MSENLTGSSLCNRAVLVHRQLYSALLIRCDMARSFRELSAAWRLFFVHATKWRMCWMAAAETLLEEKERAKVHDRLSQHHSAAAGRKVS